MSTPGRAGGFAVKGKSGTIASAVQRCVMSRVAGLVVGVCAAGVLGACATAPERAPQPTSTWPGVAAGPEAQPFHSGAMRPYEVRGRRYEPRVQPNYDETGLASWYGDAHQGRPTSIGEPFDQHALSAAHKTLPLPSLVEVTNLANGRTLVVRLNDRGPFVDGRIIDLSREAADQLGLLQAGVGRVRVRWLGPVSRETLARADRPAPPVAQTAPAPVVAPAPTPPMPSVASAWVQIGAFSVYENALSAARRFGKAEDAIRPLTTDAGTLYRVWLGPWPNAEAAEAARVDAAGQGFPDARIVASD